MLPFANMSPDPENEFLADGISEEIINTLGQIEGLRVAARGSAFSFKGKHVDPRDAGQKLNVSARCQGRSKIRPPWRRKTRPLGSWVEWRNAAVRRGRQDAGVAAGWRAFLLCSRR